MVQLRDVLERVRRDHPVVVIGRRQQDGRELRRAVGDPDVVQRGVLQQVPEVVLLVRVAKVGTPRVSDGKLVKAQHIHHSKTKTKRGKTCIGILYLVAHFCNIIIEQLLSFSPKFLPHGGNRRPEELRPLVDAGSHQESAVGAALDGQLLSAGVLLPDEEFCRTVEVVETVLLLEPAS